MFLVKKVPAKNFPNNQKTFTAKNVPSEEFSGEEFSDEE
jgi:hypothetical protein